MKSALIAAAAAATFTATFAAMPAPANAGDVQGDAYDCSELWVMRNQIYKSAGYCFASARAISYFGNGGCQYHNVRALPLSDQDRSIVSGIKKSEARQRC